MPLHFPSSVTCSMHHCEHSVVATVDKNLLDLVKEDKEYLKLIFFLTLFHLLRKGEEFII